MSIVTLSLPDAKKLKFVQKSVHTARVRDFYAGVKFTNRSKTIYTVPS